MSDLVERLAELRQAFPLNRTWALSLDAADLAEIIAALDAQPVGLTHGRHCPCSACAREDWTNPNLAPCGMHGPDCPREYAALASEPQP